jgi:formamidopyrimidine-DNA glycosylase
MPELPEVEVVRAGLAPALVGATIDHVDVYDHRSLKRHDGRRGDFVDLLTGAKVLSAQRRGKFMWFPLDRGDALIVHLGMSGQVLLREQGDTSDKHLRIHASITHPDQGCFSVNFVDQRIFGSMAIDELREQRLGTTTLMVPSQAAHIALDPLDDLFDDGAFVKRLRSRRIGVKKALLDQTLISGVGNIYADEALWAASIHYDKPSDELSAQAARRLLTEVRQVLAKALAEGGTSFDAQYVNVNGQSGYFSHSLNAYGQQGMPCPRCGRNIVKEKFMNRHSHLCPKCQKR